MKKSAPAILDRLREIAVGLEERKGLYEERDKLFLAARGLNPPIIYGELGEAAGISQEAVIQAVRKAEGKRR